MLYKGKEPVRNLQYMGKEVQTLYRGDKLVYAWHENEGENITAEYSGEYPTKSLTVCGKSEVVDGQFVDVGTAKVLHGKTVYEVEVKSTGKNLWKFSMDAETISGAAYITYFILRPNTTYTLSTNIPINGNNNADVYFNGRTTQNDGVWTNHSKSLTTDESGKIYIITRKWINDALNPNYWIQLELGSEVTAYEPYTETTTSLQLAEPLRGIPVTDPTLATYTDESGQMWCADEVNRKQLIQRISSEHTQLDTPIITDVPTDLNQLKTYDDKTSISNDQNAHMKVQYYIDTNINSWGMLSLRIQRGQLPTIGTQYKTKSAYGEITWDVVAHDYLTPEGKKHSIMLLTHDIITNLQFDAPEAIYYAENGLTAGTYNITLGGNYDTTYGGGKTYTFTLAKDVPKGGQLVLTWQYQKLPTKIASYKDSNTTSAIESVNVAEGSDGTALGTSAVKKADCSANFNCIHRTRYGSNNYKESALRQWLNSDGAKGAVWTPQTKYDRPPAWKTNSVGWLNGLQSDFLSVVQPVDVPCITNSVYEENQSLSTAYTVKDRFFLASHTEIGLSANPTLGTLLPYYEGKTNADRIKNNGANSYDWWLRSPYPSNGVSYRYVVRSGSLSVHYAYSTFGAVAACIVS